MKINPKFLAIAAMMFAAGWLEAGPPRTACVGAYPTRACGYPVGYITPFVYSSWSPIVVYANTGFSNVSSPVVASVAPVVDRVPPPVFELPSVTSTEAFGWKH